MCKCACKCKHLNRYFLPFLSVFALVFIKDVRNFMYFPIVFTFGFFVFFWNFPRLVYYTNSKPIYYEDLFLDKKRLPNYNLTQQAKEKFECIFKWTLIISNSILMGLLSDYWLYKTNDLSNYFQIIGISGGVLKIFQLINSLLGKIIIKIIKRYINIEQDKYKNQIQKTKSEAENIKRSIDIELTEVNKSNIPGSKSTSTLNKYMKSKSKESYLDI